MAVSIVGWLGLGTTFRHHKLIEPPAYTRPPVALTGEDMLPSISVSGGPPAIIQWGGIFDAPKAGRLLMYWIWTPPYSPSPGLWRGLETRLIYNLPVQQALNRCLLPDPPPFSVGVGNQLATLNGQMVTAACRLAVADGLLMASVAADARRAMAEAES